MSNIMFQHIVFLNINITRHSAILNKIKNFVRDENYYWIQFTLITVRVLNIDCLTWNTPGFESLFNDELLVLNNYHIRT